MENFVLSGFELVAALAAAAFGGVFVAQYIKDKIKGVPSPLRTALKTAETDALDALKAAQTKVVVDLQSLFKKNTATVKAAAASAPTPLPAAPAPVVAAAPAPAAAPAGPVA